MKFHPAHDLHLWPLHQDSPLGEQLIAGKTLTKIQQLAAAGISDGYLLENAYITASDWKALAAIGSPAVLKSESNDLLAWTQTPNPDDKNLVLVTASPDSFLIRHPWEFLAINESIVKNLTEKNYIGEVSPAAHIDGIVTVGEGSRILPGVVIEGNAVIGKNCKIGPNCYIRGATTIGDNCHIGQAVEIKNSIIGNNTSAGHLSYIGDSVVGNNVNLGAGTITSNFRHDGLNHRTMVNEELIDTGRRKFGTIIGDGVHTGILTAIYPGRKLGANTSTRPNDTIQKDLVAAL